MYQKGKSVLCICRFGEAFDKVTLEVAWWTFGKLGVDDWLVKIVQTMYMNVPILVRVSGDYIKAQF